MTTTLDATGEIIGTAVPGPLGSRRWEYEWRGGDVIRTSGRALYDMCGVRRQLRAGETFTLGPYRLRVLAYDFLADDYTAMREGWKARAYALAFRATGPLRRTYHRLVLTAAVWGWACYRSDMVPSWRDLRPPWKRDHS
jgi:hypothetical protein